MPIFVCMSDQPYTHDTDIQLLWRTIVDGDEKAFEKLFALFYPTLCAYAKRYIDSKQAREDIVQDVFATLWEDRRKITITGSVRFYLMIAVKNHCLNHLRKEGLGRNYQQFISDRHSRGDMEYGEAPTLNELRELLDKALSELPATYRIVFEMHQMEGKNYEEIAQTLHISVRTAKRYKSQVTDTLRKKLKDYLPLLIL